MGVGTVCNCGPSSTSIVGGNCLPATCSSQMCATSFCTASFDLLWRQNEKEAFLFKSPFMNLMCSRASCTDLCPTGKLVPMNKVSHWHKCPCSQAGDVGSGCGQKAVSFGRAILFVFVCIIF